MLASRWCNWCSQLFSQKKDKTYLMENVIYRNNTCRKGVGDILDEQIQVIIKIHNTKTKVICEFVIIGRNVEGQNFINIITSYIILRSRGIKHDRFSVKCNNGNYIDQPVGINNYW